MNTNRVLSTKYLWCWGITIFLLGIILGAVLLIANFRFVMEALRPDQNKMVENLADDIIKRLSSDFTIPESSKKRISDIVISSQPKLDAIFQKTHKQVSDFRKDIVLEVSKEIPNEDEREYFLQNHYKYFPPPPPPPPSIPPSH